MLSPIAALHNASGLLFFISVFKVFVLLCVLVSVYSRQYLTNVFNHDIPVLLFTALEVFYRQLLQVGSYFWENI